MYLLMIKNYTFYYYICKNNFIQYQDNQALYNYTNVA